jgi:hypothetical protein
MAYFVLVYDYVPDVVERRAPYRPAHLELYREWRADANAVSLAVLARGEGARLSAFDVARRGKPLSATVVKRERDCH